MADDTVQVTGYIVVTPTRSSGVDKKVIGGRFVRVTSARPNTMQSEEIAIPVTLRIPRAYWDIESIDVDISAPTSGERLNAVSSSGVVKSPPKRNRP